jgi:predicted kinase
MRKAPRGGIIAIGGPAFAGRSPLAATLAELLPRCVKLETTESLRQQSFRRGQGDVVVGERASAAVVDAAFERLRDLDPGSTVVLAARFERPELRRRMHQRARMSDVSLLYVEARSSNIRAIRRLFRIGSPGIEPARQLALYDAAVRRYVPVDARERALLPCVLLRSVLADLDAACSAVLGAWHGPV